MENDNLDFAFEKMRDTKNHVFITGNAGTGKSTLARKFIEAYKEQCIVLAPTGIAAINIGGQTIHSFFGFPARPISQNSIKKLERSYAPDYEKIKIINAAKYLIIDEISMVRADIMEQIFWFFEKNFPGKSFGGLKLIMIGDVDQLPPVIASDEERKMILARYKSEFFFHANCWNESPFEKIVLTKVFRQKDAQFVRLLNSIKNNTFAPYEIDILNAQLVKTEKLNPTDGIMLCATNATAQEVNFEMIKRLRSEAITLIGRTSGNFDVKNCTVESVIVLKKGCRVMTMRNSQDINNKYSNGSIGTVLSFDNKTESLRIELDNGNIIEVLPYEFESVDFEYNEQSDNIKHKVTGTFIQHPVRVAYAVTIHKSQGMTYDKVIIDLGERGAFAHGQVYVALSRCTSFKGITLRRPLNAKDFIYNKNVSQFNLL
jgi:ATP-dependent DNA helicase PIF1